MSHIRMLYLIITFFALFVVMLGAYTRLTDSGLGCPDWPGCYGKITVSHAQSDVLAANKLYPQNPLDHDKAWPEMIHRYFAGTLGFLIIALSLFRLNRMKKQIEDLSVVPILLILLVLMQALLGKWTVTWALHPLAVMPHLLGGISIASMLFWQLLSTQHFPSLPRPSSRILAATVGLVTLTFLQIILGGWVSSNYAALSCPDFPTCHHSLWPNMDWGAGFTLNIPRNLSTYFGGSLSIEGKIAIHMAHRMLALALTLFTLGFVSWLYFAEQAHFKRYGLSILTLLAAQITFGVLNIVAGLPLLIATTHNGIACLFLFSLLHLLYDITNSKPHLPVSKTE